MYNYIKALHIIFIVTWFSGMFYIVRLFIYHAEAQAKPEPERNILSGQLKVMIRRLWLGITWPSALLTLIFGTWIWILYGSFPHWLAIKLLFVGGLYLYHFSLHMIYQQQSRGIFKYGSNALRLWNELATVFLFIIAFLAVGKGTISLIKILIGLVILVLILMSAIRIYRRIRERTLNQAK
jgi:protoporphyrinogen IX oxidase